MNNLGSRQGELSLFESEKTGVTIHTAQGHKYTTDVFREDVFSVLVGQKTGDSIEKLVMHRGTTRNQILIGNLEQKIKAQLVELLQHLQKLLTVLYCISTIEQNMKKQLQKLSEFFIKNFEEDFENTLEDILTPEEIENIYERIMILQYLKNGLTQREIAKDLGVSIGTVSRGSRILQYGKREGNLNF